MKKLYLLVITLILSTATFAQSVILFEDFETDSVDESYPSGWDTDWMNADFDLLPYTGTAGTRPGYWFRDFAFADQDTLPTGEANHVMLSNSWTDVPGTPLENYLILPPILLSGTDGMVYWKHAPFQTPRFLDGMHVVVSTQGNTVYFPPDLTNPTGFFSDTLKTYAEFAAGEPGIDSTFSNYIFSGTGHIFGSDGQWIEYHNDSMRFRGVLRPDSASLAAYAGQIIYIAFVHGTIDDNMISLDDIKVTGTGVLSGIADETITYGELTAYPNPASDNFRVSYSNSASGPVRLNLFDVTGKMVKPISNAGQIRGNYFFDVDTKDLSNGIYTAVLENASGKSTVKITVQQ